MQSIEHVIEFLPDGTAETLHTDVLPLHELGRLSMERASAIEWNEKTQHWEVRMVLADGKPSGGIPPFQGPSRQACLDWEREYFNSEFLHR